MYWDELVVNGERTTASPVGKETIQQGIKSQTENSRHV